MKTIKIGGSMEASAVSLGCMRMSGLDEKRGLLICIIKSEKCEAVIILSKSLHLYYISVTKCVQSCKSRINMISSYM